MSRSKEEATKNASHSENQLLFRGWVKGSPSAKALGAFLFSAKKFQSDRQENALIDI